MTSKLARNFVFLHIPKAAGSAVRAMFKQAFGSKQIYPEPQLHHLPEYSSVASESPMAYLSHLGFRFARDAGAWTATVLRDPVERVLSLYSYSVHPGRGTPLLPNIDPNMTLLDFLRSHRPEIRMNLDDAQTWQIGFGYSTRERLAFTASSSADILDKALRNLDDIDIVGVSDRLPVFARSVSRFFDLKDLEWADTAVNPSERRTGREDLTNEELYEIHRVVGRDRVLYEAAQQHVAGRSA